MEPPGPLIYIVDSVRSSWIAFSCVVSSSDYESAALPLSYLGPLKTKDLFKLSTYLAAIFIKHSSFSSILPKMLSNLAVETVLYLRNIAMAFQPPNFMMTLSGTWPLRKLLTQDRPRREL